MTTDTTERGLKRLICAVVTDHPCEPAKKGEVSDLQAEYGGTVCVFCGTTVVNVA